MKRFFILTLLGFFGVCLTLSAAEQTDFDFASALFGEKDFYRAISFYKRFVFFNPSSPKLNEARYRIGQCYQKGKQADLAIENFLMIPATNSLGPLSRFQIGYTKYLNGYFPQAAVDLAQFTRDFQSIPLTGDAKYLAGLSLVNVGLWKQARAFFTNLSSIGPDCAYRSACTNLAALCLKGDRLPRKAPWLAGVMSAIIPGLGQVYSDRYLDGLSAFLITGGLGTITAYCFLDDKIDDAFGYVAGVFGAVYYIANIYGAVNAAQNGNMIIRENYKNHVLQAAPRFKDPGLDISFSRKY